MVRGPVEQGVFLLRASEHVHCNAPRGGVRPDVGDCRLLGKSTEGELWRAFRDIKGRTLIRGGSAVGQRSVLRWTPKDRCQDWGNPTEDYNWGDSISDESLTGLTYEFLMQEVVMDE